MSPSTRTVSTLTAMGLMLLAVSAAAETRMELLMVEARGCIYCTRWHAEVGPAYPATAEGQFAPLRQIDISDAVPDDIRLESPDPEKPGKRIRVIRPNLTRWDQEDFTWDEPVWIGWHAEAAHVLLQ